MKLLIDANLPWRLVKKLVGYFDDCKHVNGIGLAIPPSDTAIWNYALFNNYLIATNDEDFADMLNMKGFPPKIVLLKTGNQSTKYLGELIINHLNDIELLHHSKEAGLLEIY